MRSTACTALVTACQLANRTCTRFGTVAPCPASMSSHNWVVASNKKSRGRLRRRLPLTYSSPIPHPKKTTDADDERGHLAVAIDEHVHDLADLAVLRIIDTLLVPMSDGFAVGWDARHHLSSLRRILVRAS